MKRLSVTVGTVVVLVTVPGERYDAFRKYFLPSMSEVLLTSGQINRANSRVISKSQKASKDDIETTNPRIPSTSWNPVDLEATPMDCSSITRPGPRVTVSVTEKSSYMSWYFFRHRILIHTFHPGERSGAIGDGLYGVSKRKDIHIAQQ